MDSSYSDEVAKDLSPLLKVYTDGRIERLMGTEVVPPCDVDPKTNVQSKDVVISQEPNISSRLYLPKDTKPNQKLPVLVYFHGGGFVIGSAFSPFFHNYLNSLVSEAKLIAISVDYRLAPEHPLPAAYEDSWAALKWVASHADGDGPEEWINSHADLGKVFLAGDSAGANISHNIGIKFGQEKLHGIDILGIILAHPYFWGKEAIGNEPGEGTEQRAFVDAFWPFANPTSSSGNDDPLINPLLNPNMASLGCKRVLVAVAEKDVLRDRGWCYYEHLGKCGWDGVVEITEAKGEDHEFHLFNPTCENALDMLSKFASFFNVDR